MDGPEECEGSNSVPLPMSLPTSEADEKRVLNEANPPIVSATLVPAEPVAIVEDAQLANEPTLAVACTSIHREYTRGTSLTSTSSSYQQEFSLHSAAASARLEHDSLRSPPVPVPVPVRIPHEVADVRIDDEETLDTADTENCNQREKNQRRQQIVTKCSRIYLVISTITFIIGLAGIIGVSISFKSETNKQPQVPNPSAPSYSLDIPTSAPSSQSPSLSPSCSGRFSQVFSMQVRQAGSMFFTMDRDGNTVVVSIQDYQAEASHLRFFDLLNEEQFQTEATYHIHDLKISGDGNTLACGVNSYEGNLLGGAVLIFKKLGDQWFTPIQIESGGGYRGAVHSVSLSYDGSVVAYVSSDGFIDVVRKDNSTDRLTKHGNRLNGTSIDENTKIDLSGDGARLFVSASQKVTAYEMNNGTNTWERLGSSIQYDFTTNIMVSYDGSILAVGSTLDFPVVVYEEWKDSETNQTTWEVVSTLDNSMEGSSQYLALSSDGRNVVVGETLRTQENVARLYHRSGSQFISAQDIMLGDGLLRGIALNPAGEQLTVAVDDAVTAYRKDCGSRGLFQQPPE